MKDHIYVVINYNTQKGFHHRDEFRVPVGLEPDAYRDYFNPVDDTATYQKKLQVTKFTAMHTTWDGVKVVEAICEAPTNGTEN